jgi:putative phage-type endonuclease
MHPESTAPESAPYAPVAESCLTPSLPGTPEWFRTMSASKVAAVLDASDYDSPRSLWNKMAGLDYPGNDGDDSTRRGHYLEEPIARWFADQHPEGEVLPACEWRSTAYPWAHATPDRHFWVTGEDGEPQLRLVECKSSAKPDEWGRPGTDEVPTGYWWQCQWQMFVTGCDVVHVAVLGAFLRFDEYVVHRNDEMIAWLLRETSSFMDSLPSDGKPGNPPPVDGHQETLASVQRVYGAPEDRAVDVGEELADGYLAAFHAVQAAEEAKREAACHLLEAAAGGNRVVVDGRTIGTISVTKAGAASLRPNPTAVKESRHRSAVVEDRF